MNFKSTCLAAALLLAAAAVAQPVANPAPSATPAATPAPAPAPAPAAAPAPAPAKVGGETASAPDPLFVVHLTKGPKWVAGKEAHEQPGFREHSANLARLRNEGLLVMGARYKDKQADKGMMLFRAANREAVLKLFDADPMIKGANFAIDVAEFVPFYDGFVARPARSAAAPGALEKLQWLAGCWFGKNGKLEFREHWMRAAGNVMIGMGRTLNDGKVIGHEAMRIELDKDGATQFVAKPMGQPEAAFKLVSSDNDRFVFENPMHDFPTRVIYQLNTNGGLDARIEGKQGGRDARVEFPMRRAGCE